LRLVLRQSARVMVSFTVGSEELPLRLDVSSTRMTGAVVDMAIVQAVVACAHARPGSAVAAMTPNKRTKNQYLERPTMIVRLSQHGPCQSATLLLRPELAIDKRYLDLAASAAVWNG